MSVTPEDLRPHYRAFLEDGRRVLLTGHSHQAWPDVAREGLVLAFDVAARDVDEKWAAVFEAQEELRAHVAARIGARPQEIAFGQNTHELVTRFLSALPLTKRPRLVTTTGEFHSADRQLRRLREEGVDVVFIETAPVATLAERLLVAAGETASAILASTVLFETSTLVPHVAELTAGARARGVEVLLDAYHAFDVVPFTVPEGAFLVAGGYKYAQWGEGACFLRVPEGVMLRPAITGWFAGFRHLEARRTDAQVAYEADGATRFAGSTFDPASFFRARAVARFFDERGLTPEALRATSLAQTSRILAAVARLPAVSIATPLADAERGGFVALRTPNASRLVEVLRAAGVLTDARGDLLRLGPAPYVTDDELDRAMGSLAEALTRASGSDPSRALV